jgi:hypothetical protein
MNRRCVVLAAAATILVSPLRGMAQTPGRIQRIGFLCIRAVEIRLRVQEAFFVDEL